MLFAGTLFAQWQLNYTVAQIPQKLYAYSTDTAFIVGNTNTLYRTNDKGVTWSQITLTTTSGNLMDITFLDANDGFIANASGLVLHSLDKGTSWSSLSLSGFSDGSGNSASDPTLGTSLKFNTITCSQNIIYTALKWTDIAVPAVTHGYIFKSIDKGVTWTKLGSDLLGVTINSIEVVEQTIYIVGSSGTFKKSIDGGENWTSEDLSAYGSINDIRIIDANTFYLSAGTGILKSIDAGENITPLLNSKPSFDALCFSDLGVIFSVGLSANIARNINDGSTWDPAKLGLGTTTNIFDLTLFNNTIFAMGGDKKIYTLAPNQLLDPVADFTTKLNDLSVDFSNTSLNSGSYSWDFGDGSAVSIEVNPTHTYANVIPSTYSVTLTAGNAVTQVTIDPSKIINIAQSADFEYVVGDARQVTFTNLSQNNTTYSWDFGDGSAVSTDKDPVHTYTTYGTFSVKLTASDGVTPQEVTKEVIVPQPISNFSVLVEAGKKATFTNLSQNSSSYSWNFGDGTSASTDENPVHTYASFGSYNVTLTAGDGATTVDFSQEVVIPEPIASFNAVVEGGDKVTFTNTSSNCVSYTWDFGDGTAESTDENPIHTYTAYGIFTVKLTGSDGVAISELTKDITISQPIPDFSFVIGANKTVTFTNLSQNSSTYTWDFGDGTTVSTDENPSHTYADYATYTVTLVAASGIGSESTTKDVAILQVFVDFSFVVNGGEVTFTNLSQNATTYSWDFGDGSALSAEDNPVHIYSAVGDFIVKLTAGDGVAEAYATKTVTILQPTADFSFEITNGNAVAFTNLSQNSTSYSWDFGDGTAVSNDVSPTHAYSVAGNFNVKLTSSSSTGSAEVTKEVQILAPVINFSYVIEEGNKVTFTNLSQNCSTYSWDLGTGVSSTSVNASFYYPQLGSFDVTLTGTSGLGSDTNTQTVTIDSVGSQWSYLITGANQNLQKLHAFNNDTAIIIGNSTAIVRTTDGGSTWASASYPTENVGFIGNDIIFYDDNTGLASFSASGSINGFIMKTTDNGQSWSPLSLSAFSDGSDNAVTDPAATTASKVYFFFMAKISSTTSFATLRWVDASNAYHGYVYKTTDQGSTWTKVSVDIFTDYSFSSFITCMAFDPTGTTGYIGGNMYLLKTIDGGATWTDISKVEYGYINDIVVKDANNVFLATGIGTIKTTDGFSTYSFVTTDFSFDIIALNDTTYLSGKFTTLKISRDSGATWELTGNGIGSSFFELAIFNNKVYALGNSGKAYISLLDFYFKPVLDFSYTRGDKVVTFTNLSANTKSYEWTFGDEQSSVEVSPIHTYTDYGTFSVTLNGSNLCWKGEPKTVEISILTGIDTKELNGFKIWPNPATQGFVNFSLGAAFEETTTVNITDIQGRLVFTQKIDSSRQIDVNLNPGIYIVRVVSNQVSATQKLIIK